MRAFWGNIMTGADACAGKNRWLSYVRCYIQLISGNKNGKLKGFCNKFSDITLLKSGIKNTLEKETFSTYRSSKENEGVFKKYMMNAVLEKIIVYCIFVVTFNWFVIWMEMKIEKNLHSYIKLSEIVLLKIGT